MLRPSRLVFRLFLAQLMLAQLILAQPSVAKTGPAAAQPATQPPVPDPPTHAAATHRQVGHRRGTPHGAVHHDALHRGATRHHEARRAPHGTVHHHSAPVVAPHHGAVRHPPALPPGQAVIAIPKVTPAPAPVPKSLEIGTSTGLKLPRFASLKTDDVNLRAGPGDRYPVQWVYQRRDLPVQIEREFDVWRQIEDMDGVKGWVHQATLSGRRSVIVTGAPRTLRADKRDDSAAVAVLKPGVIAHLRSCDAATNWCAIEVQGYQGWLKRDDFWGTLPGEIPPP